MGSMIKFQRPRCLFLKEFNAHATRRNDIRSSL